MLKMRRFIIGHFMRKSVKGKGKKQHDKWARLLRVEVHKKPQDISVNHKRKQQANENTTSGNLLPLVPYWNLEALRREHTKKTQGWKIWRTFSSVQCLLCCCCLASGRDFSFMNEPQVQHQSAKEKEREQESECVGESES